MFTKRIQVEFLIGKTFCQIISNLQDIDFLPKIPQFKRAS